MDSNNNNIIYQLVHLGPHENLFIFANEKLIMFDHVNKRVVRHYPNMSAYSNNYVQTSASTLILYYLIIFSFNSMDTINISPKLNYNLVNNSHKINTLSGHHLSYRFNSMDTINTSPKLNYNLVKNS